MPVQPWSLYSTAQVTQMQESKFIRTISINNVEDARRETRFVDPARKFQRCEGGNLGGLGLLVWRSVYTSAQYLQNDGIARC